MDGLVSIRARNGQRRTSDFGLRTQDFCSQFSITRRDIRMVAAVVLIRAIPGDVPALARRIAGIDGVTEVYSVSGDWDLIAVLRVSEYERIAEIVTEEIAQVQGIERTNTLTAFRVYSKQDLGAAWDMFD